jgi:protein CpxP
MKKQTLLWCVLALLFLMNIVTLGLLLFSKGDMHDTHRSRPAFDENVIKTLQLTPDQIQTFNELKSQHHQQMMDLDEAMKAPFSGYFSYLTKEESNIDSRQILENTIDSLFRLKLKYTYQHFEQLKSICTPEQKSKFSILVPQLMQVMQPPPNRMPPPPEERP